jgi:uncharacterized membrane protein YfcA
MESLTWLTGPFLGFLVGIVLALTGAGGGILGVPLLTLGLGLGLTQAAPIAVCAVAVASALGAVMGLREGIVRYRAATVIALGGMLTAPLGVWLGLHLPTRPLTYALALILAALALRRLRRRAAQGPAQASAQTPAQAQENPAASHAPPCHTSAQDGRLIWTAPCARIIASTGALAGLLNGLFGVGGGFVVVPALERQTDLALHSIQATSLMAIALVSLVSAGTAALTGTLDVQLALEFSAGACAGILAGLLVSQHLPTQHREQIFAWTVLLAAVLLAARASGWL